MVDITQDILDEAASHDLVSLADAKLMLGVTNNNSDALISLLISQGSATIAEVTNRTLARERLVETWRCNDWLTCPGGMTRLFLTHYPVKKSELESVELLDGTVIDPAYYYLDERSGKLTLEFECDAVAVTYTGGYLLPDEAPLPLQQALGLYLRKGRAAAAAGEGAGSAVAQGVRMIAHKGARVMFFSPKDMLAGATGSGSGGTSDSIGIDTAVKNLLINYTRLEV